VSDFFFQLLLILDSTLRIATPLMLCAMAGIFSERSGIVDISLEGKMLSGAFVAATVAALTGSAWAGLFCAMGAGVFMSLIHGFACITHRGDHVVSGVAINILASGLTVVLGIALFRRGGQTPHLPKEDRFTPIEWIGVSVLDPVPVVGAVYRQLISGHNPLVYGALIAVPVCAFIIYHTRFGLRLRAVGEVPEAVDSAGVSVAWLRYRALIAGGLLCGIAGAYLSIAQGAHFVREMSAGKGYIALAAVIFGNWRPIPAFLACLLFGFLEAWTARLQGTTIWLLQDIPTPLVQAMPYVLTVLLLAGLIGRPRPPAAIGQPYGK